jgi:hypothetical protein
MWIYMGFAVGHDIRIETIGAMHVASTRNGLDHDG